MFENLTLKDDEVVIVGRYTFEKDGKIGTTISYLREFRDWQKERGNVSGLYAETEFTRMDCSGLNVGDVVRLAYQKGFKGQAELTGYSVVRRVNMEKG